MAAVSNSVVHLTMRFERTTLAIGTGVVYERDGKYYVVTAWHNLTGRHPDNLKFQSSQNAVPDNVVVNLVVSHPPFGATRMSVILPLADEDKSLFLIHPTRWPRVDVVAIPFDPMGNFKFEYWNSDNQIVEGLISLLNTDVPTELCPIQRYLVPDKTIIDKWMDNVEVTEELFIPGYPHNVQDDYSQPVWKRATIASSVQKGFNGQPKFLIDSASKSGMSGSPVLYYSPKGSISIGGGNYRFGTDVAILVGVYVGREAVTDKADPQIGIVWHRSVIDEIIDGGCFERLPYDIEVKSDELDKAINEEFKTCSKKGLANILNPDMPSRLFVRDRVLQKLQGRAVPKEVVEAMVRLAKIYEGPLVPDDDI
ncbi:hypothetical protein [Pseudomonas fluorescens]|uniref:hypothetical protein n=1 Tax=Pseudomonas fluorescens TaxID=294 RepID=UPI00058A785F|nr:hypothetical protein [Pseudomonas fluorescens]CEL29048.1 hypothetical protein SRM1_02396 [Pseudomonas fluorescens]